MNTDYTTGVDLDDICTDCITDNIDEQRQIAINEDLSLIEVIWNRKDFVGMKLKVLETYPLNGAAK